ncbi:FecR family protein [Mariniflexile sp. HMF6888]|uniref:FecR family protein n=1 Tax=Mariniflexile sp. HMF6888 TaxID=3373086 RepID=UPI0037A75412
MQKYILLIDKFLNRTISSKERKVLKKWILENDDNMKFFKNRIKEFSQNTKQDFDADMAYQRFLNILKSKEKTPKLFHTVLRYAAVFVVLLAIGFLTKNLLSMSNIKPSEKLIGNDIIKGSNIVVKLADGSTKVLKSEGDEKIADAKGNIIANKGDNLLSFDNKTDLVGSKTMFNEIYIPYGQTFKLKLSDGTMVWLNAGSKLRFPQKFTDSDKNRMVYLEGEAFFEVTKNKDKPFIVNTNEVNVEVLGTKFNISSYETDSFIATTLVEGSVSVYETGTPENALLLKPSFQASYDKFGNHFSKKKVNTDIYTAWMQNRLVIDNLKFSEILVWLERKYHVEFVNKTTHLNNKIYKGEFDNEDIETILKTIALSTPFKYEINQDVITITE